MSPGFRITASTGLHKGDREYQQDQLLLLSHARVHGCVLAAVADGMGGRSGGRKASDQVMMTARQLFERFDPYNDDPRDLLKNIIAEAHLVIKLTAISAEEEPHSTAALFLITPQGQCHWAHAGDSRIYHFHKERLVKRTLDHSFVQNLVERGEITPEEANTHPNANILLGCLGTEADPPVDEHLQLQLQPGDTLLACSDGLWHYFTDNELGSILSSLPPREASEILVEQARKRARGTGDNLSLVLVHISAL
ncbi:MAG: protein phosphatase 2C domain-containing protein [Burkholderiales bacterium]|jgi:serine/threonine protein phosphatase PrpC|nr:protein phosphatase 2C domain-containing protein [Burkholderiales bacterium]